MIIYPFLYYISKQRCQFGYLHSYSFIVIIYKVIFSSCNFLIPLRNGDTLADFVSVRTLVYAFLGIQILTFIFVKEYCIFIYFFKLKIGFEFVMRKNIILH